MEWIDLAHGEGKVTGCCEYGGEPLGSKIFFTTCGSSPLSTIFCSRILLHAVSQLVGVKMNVRYCSAAVTWHWDKQRLRTVVCGKGE